MYLLIKLVSMSLVDVHDRWIWKDVVRFIRQAYYERFFLYPPCSSSYRKFSNVPKETPSPQRKNVLSFDHLVQAEQMNDLYYR